MAAEETHVAILFADICDSTPLYEESGDEAALRIIAERLDDLAAIAAANAGEVIRSKGDDVLCTFDDPGAAVQAASGMVEAYGAGTAAIRVGIHFGPVIRARSDIFGDAVNVAARMLALAKTGEAITSEELVERLDLADRGRMTRIGRREIKGKVEPMDVYSMMEGEGEVTQMAWGASPSAPDPMLSTVTIGATVEIEHPGGTMRVGDGESCLIGRSERCDLVVGAPSVSREHALVTVRGARVIVADQSSTGTWVIDREGTRTTLRRDSAQLYHTGRLRLGRHPRDPQPAVELTFRVVHDH